MTDFDETWIIPVPSGVDDATQFIYAVRRIIETQLVDIPPEHVYHALKYLTQLQETAAFPAPFSVSVAQGTI